MSYKKSVSVLILSFLLVVTSFSFASDLKPQSDDIVGVWLIEEDNELVEKIEIYKCGDLYCGKIVWLKQSDTTNTVAVDKKNKKKELRDRPLLGLEVLKGYSFNGKDRWQDGKFYAHRKGRTVSPKLTLIDANQLKIQVKILFVKKSFVWNRELSDSTN